MSPHPLPSPRIGTPHSQGEDNPFSPSAGPIPSPRLVSPAPSRMTSPQHRVLINNTMSPRTSSTPSPGSVNQFQQQQQQQQQQQMLVQQQQQQQMLTQQQQQLLQQQQNRFVRPLVSTSGIVDQQLQQQRIRLQQGIRPSFSPTHIPLGSPQPIMSSGINTGTPASSTESGHMQRNIYLGQQRRQQTLQQHNIMQQQNLMQQQQQQMIQQQQQMQQHIMQGQQTNKPLMSRSPMHQQPPGSPLNPRSPALQGMLQQQQTSGMSQPPSPMSRTNTMHTQQQYMSGGGIQPPSSPMLGPKSPIVQGLGEFYILCFVSCYLCKLMFCSRWMFTYGRGHAQTIKHWRCIYGKSCSTTRNARQAAQR